MLKANRALGLTKVLGNDLNRKQKYFSYFYFALQSKPKGINGVK